LGHWFRRYPSSVLWRPRIATALIATICVSVSLLSVCWWTLHIEAQNRVRQFLPANAWQQNDVRDNLAALAAQVAAGDVFVPSRPVYRYSVVPGGVRSSEELRRAVQRDRAVARHYAGFDFQRAHLRELAASRFVYLSYRRGDRVFWTHKQIALHKGEMLISDGKITARTRCANQISVLPRAETAPDEPRAEDFEDPSEQGGSATHFDFPGKFEAALLNRPRPAGLEGQGSGYPGSGPIFGPSGGGFPGIFPPPVAPGTCEPLPKPKPKDELASLVEDQGSNKKKKKTACSPGPTPPPATVPEPASFLLISSGLAGIYARRYWRKRPS